jgi:hypothetical protein
VIPRKYVLRSNYVGIANISGVHLLIRLERGTRRPHEEARPVRVCRDFRGIEDILPLDRKLVSIGELSACSWISLPDLLLRSNSLANDPRLFYGVPLCSRTSANGLPVTIARLALVRTVTVALGA